jgi:3-methyladenine DNA glycosylase/8-oxoguanine DNA glycosylase
MSVLMVGVRINGQPAIVEIHQKSERPEVIAAISLSVVERAQLRNIVCWLVCADLDLAPFYHLAMAHPVMGPVVDLLRGLKPLRPASLFEMLVVAVTEQQLSLAAAYHIRNRLIKRFGTPFGGMWIFPTPASLGEASLAELRDRGLSHRKAEYVRGIAIEVAAGQLDLEGLKRMSDAEARARLACHRGFGDWSIQYILARGLGRSDCLPSGDVGLRRALGRYFSCGRRLAPEELERGLFPFAPFRSLAAYYLAVHARLFPEEGVSPPRSPRREERPHD